MGAWLVLYAARLSFMSPGFPLFTRIEIYHSNPESFYFVSMTSVSIQVLPKGVKMSAHSWSIV
jgi:hypothetical protein